ncbi:MAG: prephenate dehydrogenase [Phycisphaerae bacterium]
MVGSTFQRVAIVGVGLLGGSVALGLRRRNPDVHVVGIGRRESSLDTAMELGIIDSSSLHVSEGIRGCDLVILATPVGTFEMLLEQMAGSLEKGALVTDVGSTKREVVETAERILGARGPFVGSHPMAGSEKTGPENAREDLLDGATCIVTPGKKTPAKLTLRTQNLWTGLGMKVVTMSPAEHDQAVGDVSHLPHLLSCLLMVLPDDEHLSLGATGFADMTRLAAGEETMWRDIFLSNRLALLDSVEQMLTRLNAVRSDLEANEPDLPEKLMELLTEARRRKLDQSE